MPGRLRRRARRSCPFACRRTFSCRPGNRNLPPPLTRFSARQRGGGRFDRGQGLPFAEFQRNEAGDDVRRDIDGNSVFHAAALATCRSRCAC